MTTKGQNGNLGDDGIILSLYPVGSDYTTVSIYQSLHNHQRCF